MARYVFRLSILGPTALDAARIGAAVNPVFARYGFSTEPVEITNVKGVAAPTQQTRTPTVRETLPGEPPPSGAAEPIWGYWAYVPPWGWIFVDDAPAAANVRALTQASVVIHGTLPPPSATGRAGSGILSSAVFAAVNAAFSASGFYNLAGRSYAAGLVETSSGGGGAGAALLLVGLGIAYAASQSREGRLFGLRGVSAEATRLRRRAQVYRHAGRHVAAKELERKANRLSR